MATNKWGDLVAKLNELRIEKAELAAKIRAIDKTYEELSAPLIDFLQKNGLNTIAPDKSSATISEETYWNIEDQEKFQKWVYDTQSLFVLKRTLVRDTINDLVNAGEEVPGLKSFTKTKLSIKSIK
jgi:hypothetical protein